MKDQGQPVYYCPYGAASREMLGSVNDAVHEGDGDGWKK